MESSGTATGRKKRPLAAVEATAEGDRKRPLAAADAAAAAAEGDRSKRPRQDDEADDDDLSFLLRLQQEQAQEEVVATGGRRGAQLKAIVQRLRHPNDTDDEDEEETGGNGGRQAGRAAQARAGQADTGERGRQGFKGEDEEEDEEERPGDIFTALELWDFEASQRLLAADPDLVSCRDSAELCMPLSVAIAARFDRGVKLLLSQAEPPCPLLLVDGRGYSALHLAVEAYADLPFLARFLLQYRGVDIDTLAPAAPLADGAAPLHVAVRTEDDKALRLLLASGADPSLRDGNGRTALDLVGQWPAGSKARKRARHLLTRRAPFASYALHKLRFLARVRRGEGKNEQAGTANEAVAALSRTAAEQLLALRVGAQAQEVDPWEAPGHGNSSSSNEDDQILCRLETAGVYSFVSATGRLCLARVDRAVSPLLLESKPAAPPTAPTAAAATSSSSSSSSATTSPSSSPLTSSNTEAAAPALASSLPLSPTCCPLSRLKAARADIFDMGDADEETVLSRQNSLMGVGQEEQMGGIDGEPWVLLPPLPGAEVHRKEGDDEAVSLPAAVLHHVVFELRDEGVFDALQAMLWR